MTLQVPQRPDPQPPDRPDPVKIGLWGPQESGKTTYLAALTIAESDLNPGNGSWRIWPRSDGATELKEKFQRELGEEGHFPEATTPGSEVKLEWLFFGNLTGSKFDRRWLRPLRGKLESSFLLDLIDVHGSAYTPPKEVAEDKEIRPADQPAGAGAVSAALDHLAAAQGIIFLFDPTAELEDRDSAAYVRWTINQLLQRTERPGLYLPHQLSVCVTKFDDPRVFYQARKRHLVEEGHDGMPRVPDKYAEQFFDELCSGRFWDRRQDRGRRSAEIVRDQLQRYFNPARIRYFVTSSIGFPMEPPTEDRDAWFNPGRATNVTTANGRPSIIGKVHPINVLEPLISLQQRIAKG